jgi:hypothetical protein
MLYIDLIDEGTGTSNKLAALMKEDKIIFEEQIWNIKKIVRAKKNI